MENNSSRASLEEKTTTNAGMKQHTFLLYLSGLYFSRIFDITKQIHVF
jgi:hypothetical protein